MHCSIYSLEMPNGVYRFCIDPKNRIPSISRTGFRMWKKNILRLKINVLRINVNYEACLGGIQMVIQARNSHSFFLTVALLVSSGSMCPWSKLFELQQADKGVSDLETCIKWHTAEKNLATSQNTFEQTVLSSKFWWGSKLFGQENKNSHFHNFFLEVQNNPYEFLNLRHLY